MSGALLDIVARTGTNACDVEYFPFFFFAAGRYLTPLYAELTRAPLDSDEIELPRFPWWEAYCGQRVHAVRPALLTELISSIQRLRSIVSSGKEYRFPKERRLSLIHMFSDATLKQCGVEIVAEGADTFGLVPTAEGRLRWGATFAEAIHGIPLAAKNTGVTESESRLLGQVVGIARALTRCFFVRGGGGFFFFFSGGIGQSDTGHSPVSDPTVGCVDPVWIAIVV